MAARHSKGGRSEHGALHFTIDSLANRRQASPTRVSLFPVVVAVENLFLFSMKLLFGSAQFHPRDVTRRSVNWGKNGLHGHFRASDLLTPSALDAGRHMVFVAAP